MEATGLRHSPPSIHGRHARLRKGTSRNVRLEPHRSRSRVGTSKRPATPPAVGLENPLTQPRRRRRIRSHRLASRDIHLAVSSCRRYSEPPHRSSGYNLWTRKCSDRDRRLDVEPSALTPATEYRRRIGWASPDGTVDGAA